MTPSGLPAGLLLNFNVPLSFGCLNRGTWRASLTPHTGTGYPPGVLAAHTGGASGFLDEFKPQAPHVPELLVALVEAPLSVKGRDLGEGARQRGVDAACRGVVIGVGSAYRLGDDLVDD